MCQSGRIVGSVSVCLSHHAAMANLKMTRDMHDEWTTVISGDRLVKFTYVDLPSGGAFMTAQIAGHEVVYSILSDEVQGPLSRVYVEHSFA